MLIWWAPAHTYTERESGESKRSKRLAQIRDTERESGEAKRQTRMRDRLQNKTKETCTDTCETII